MSTKTTERKPMPEPAGGWPSDNYTGLFGRFKRDPFTGVREPADEETRTAMEAQGITSANGPIGEPAAVPASTAAPAPASTPSTSA